MATSSPTFMRNPDIIIIGGGLTGLATAFLLGKQGFTPRILEARGRLGGRIHTLRPEGEPPLEMGATWLGRKHHHLTALLDELGLDIEEQHMGRRGYYEPMSVSPPQLVELPANEEPSYRIAGGTDRLVGALQEQLSPDQLHLNTAVKAVKQAGDALEVRAAQKRYRADYVVSTLPPRLLTDPIAFSPALPDRLTNIAALTHTWMASAIKVALTFDEPFWRDEDSSGTIFSNVGPVNEMYDHCGEGRYALKGFMNEAYQAVSQEQRRAAVMKQLRRFYGDKANRCRAYHDRCWQDEPYSYRAYPQPVIPHQHNGHAVFREPFWEGRLLFAGSETAAAFPGYMDGAVESARRAVQQLDLPAAGGPM